MKRIPLSRNKYAIVDDEDYELLSRFKWHVSSGKSNTYYAQSELPDTRYRIRFSMHRLIMKAEKNQEVDHRNGNGLDNRRRNLRLCTKHQNRFNMRITTGSSKYKGVSWHTKNGKWRARITLNYQNIYIGCFTSEREAAKAYDRKAKQLFGDFAYLNFPGGATCLLIPE